MQNAMCIALCGHKAKDLWFSRVYSVWQHYECRVDRSSRTMNCANGSACMPVLVCEYVCAHLTLLARKYIGNAFVQPISRQYIHITDRVPTHLNKSAFACLCNSYSFIANQRLFITHRQTFFDCIER